MSSAAKRRLGETYAVTEGNKEEPVEEPGAADENTPGDAASLAASVLAEEAARHAEQESSQVLFPDDLLPGVRSEGIWL